MPIDDLRAELALQQLADSAFPTGAFAHSFGLETYIQEGVIHDGTTLETFIAGTLRHGTRRSDALALAAAHAAMSDDDLPTILELDGRLTALKSATELRQASVQIGRQFLRTALRLYPVEPLRRLRQFVEEGDCQGHHSVVFGAVCAVAGVGQGRAVAAYLHAHAAGQVSVAVRLIPLGATEGQRVLRSLHPAILETAEFVMESPDGELGGFTPALEIRSMQHARLFARLFLS